TDRGSEHPTVVEAIRDMRFEDALRAITGMEVSGIRDVEETFGRGIAAFSSHGGTHAAPYMRIAALHGVPWLYSPAVPGDRGAGFFTGGLHLAAFVAINETFYAEPDLLEGRLRAIDAQIDAAKRAGRIWACIFLGHPARLRADLLDDAMNLADGEDILPRRMPPLRPPETLERARDGLRLAARRLAAMRDLEIVPIAEVVRRIGRSDPRAARGELAEAAETARLAGPFGIPLYGRLSPAQATCGWARALLESSDPIEVGDPLGPFEEPERHTRAEALDPRAIRRIARAVLASIGQSGAIPARVRAEGIELPAGAAHHALAEAFLDASHGAARILRPSPLYGRYPAEAYEIDARVRHAIISWPIHPPEIATDAIARDFRLQSWTLREVVP
ncbi:MAG: hypothetical protein JXP34_14040, partial [Planctomycetes bacterium]|nr:hypothetical protein [Planctomycetota bacterium]